MIVKLSYKTDSFFAFTEIFRPAKFFAVNLSISNKETVNKTKPVSYSHMNLSLGLTFVPRKGFRGICLLLKNA